ncbi:MAG: GNAT family N-acetyltransferase [Bacilli bacterium]
MFPKQYFCKTIETEDETIIIEGPVTGEAIKNFTFHPGLCAFRQPKEQHVAVAEIADLPEGRIIIARVGQEIMGYVTFLYPDPLERWSEAKMENLIELGAIEVASPIRGQHVGSEMLKLAMQDPAMEHYIIITTEYYWHWDLKGTGLSVWKYRDMMEKMMETAGLKWFATDDPEICSHPANCLMARIGAHITPDDIQRFDRIRFLNRFLY